MQRVLLIALLPGAILVSGCGSGNARTDAKYCAAVNQHLTELNSPQIVTSADVAKAVAVYQTIAKAAPLAVEKEWDVLTIAYQTAATVTVNDPASARRVVDAINGSQHSASAAAEYTRRLCNVQIGTPTVPTTPAAPSSLPPTPTTTS
ncbi:MAG: hypothetical protein ABIR68_12800 [Ilumatobacteraceae bacterium]